MKKKLQFPFRQFFRFRDEMRKLKIGILLAEIFRIADIMVRNEAEEKK
jgi:hypothetical protein